MSSASYSSESGGTAAAAAGSPQLGRVAEGPSAAAAARPAGPSADAPAPSLQPTPRHGGPAAAELTEGGGRRDSFSRERGEGAPSGAPPSWAAASGMPGSPPPEAAHPSDETLLEILSSVKSLTKEVGANSAKLDSLAGEVKVANDKIDVLTADVSVLRADVSIVKADGVVLKADGSVLKVGVSVLKENWMILTI